MRRLAAITLVLAAGGTVGSLVLGASARGSSTQRIDVVFDDARGLIGGQLAKVAGARAGTIENVTVTPDFKARIEMSIDSRFPFHQDATCTIRPEGLIAENYVDCDPGTSSSPPLKAANGLPPTVPVENTTEPVNLLNLFNMFNLPTRERFQVIINELGIASAGRGQDINEIILRANPALALARQAIGILDRQRAQIATIVDATNTIAAQAAGHTASLQDFLDRAAAVSRLTADHRGSLSQAINRLPGLLAEAQPALAQLDTVAVNGTPLVQQIHAAVPSLNKVAIDLGPFVAVAKPGLAKLGAALQRAIPAIHDVTPVVGTLRRYVTASLPSTRLAGRLFSNLQRHGFVENFLSSFYYIAAALARFDSTSHIVPVFFVDVANGACGNYATTPVAGCSAHYGSSAVFKPSRVLARRATEQTTRTRASGAPLAPRAGAPSGAPSTSALPASATLSQLQQILHGGQQQSAQALQSLITYLLK